MCEDKLLEMLRDAGDHYVSGQTMSRELGITRGGIWKQISRLREKGYEIAAVTNCGYRLISEPERLSQERVLELLGDHPWSGTLTVLDQVDSTNNRLKSMGDQGAPEGTIVMSDEQTSGRGRLGRSFVSPKGVGLYYSLLLRPRCAPKQVSHVTAMAAVAVCDAVESTCGLRPQIKWTNDIILAGKKLAGILTELSVEWETSSLQYLVTGIGINCNQKSGDFPNEIAHMAQSLYLVLGKPVDRALLAAELTRALERVSRELISKKAEWLEQYRKDCITLGREIQVLRGEQKRTGVATGIDENGGLIVRYDTGETGVVYSGEVSVRGMYGYV